MWLLHADHWQLSGLESSDMRAHGVALPLRVRFSLLASHQSGAHLHLVLTRRLLGVNRTRIFEFCVRNGYLCEWPAQWSWSLSTRSVSFSPLFYVTHSCTFTGLNMPPASSMCSWGRTHAVAIVFIRTAEQDMYSEAAPTIVCDSNLHVRCRCWDTEAANSTRPTCSSSTRSSRLRRAPAHVRFALVRQHSFQLDRQSSPGSSQLLRRRAPDAATARAHCSAPRC